MSRVIGLFGKSGSGKDTYADEIEKFLTERGYKCKNLRFANKIKEIVSEQTGVPLHLLNDNEFKATTCPTNGMTYRKMLTDVGALGRVLNKDIWVNETIRRIEDDERIYIIRDGRFPNEIGKLKSTKHCVNCVKLIPEYEGYKVLDSGSDVSETSLDNFTMRTIHNTDKNLISNQVEEFLKSIILK